MQASIAAAGGPMRGSDGWLCGSLWWGPGAQQPATDGAAPCGRGPAAWGGGAGARRRGAEKLLDLARSRLRQLLPAVAARSGEEEEGIGKREGRSQRDWIGRGGEGER